MKKAWLFKNNLCAAAIFLLTAVTPALGAPPEGSGRGFGKFREFMEELNLTPEQREKVRQLHREEGPQFKSRDAMKDARKKLGDLLGDPKASEADINRAKEEYKLAQAEMTDKRVRKMLELRKILTPEQYLKLADKMKQAMKDKFQSKFGRGGPGAGQVDGED